MSPRAASTRNSRDTAARLVGAWLSHGTFPDHLIEEVADDRAFVMELVYGVVRWCRALDFVLAQLASQKPAPRLQAILLVGLYQLLFLDHVAAYAAVNETVAAAKTAGGRRAANFVNAVLRRVATAPDTYRNLLAGQPAGVRLSHPDALVARWSANYGEAQAAAICAWDNVPPRVVLRVDGTRIRLFDYQARLREQGANAVPHPARPAECLVLEGGVAVAKLPGYTQGWVTVQDPSTLIAVDVLAPQSGERVLDVCAAPGGKTMAIAQRMEGRGVLLALDADASRLATVRENAARLQYGWIQIAAADLTAGAPDVPELRPASFDAVLLDVPCTNTGVLRRRPDARWRFTKERLAEAVAKQRRLLDAAAPFVRPGGRLVYSTCSLEPEENSEQVRAWLAEHRAFRLDGEQQLVPPASETDGAYAACLKRDAS